MRGQGKIKSKKTDHISENNITKDLKGMEFFELLFQLIGKYTNTFDDVVSIKS